MNMETHSAKTRGMDCESFPWSKIVNVDGQDTSCGWLSVLQKKVGHASLIWIARIGSSGGQPRLPGVLLAAADRRIDVDRLVPRIRGAIGRVLRRRRIRIRGVHFEDLDCTSFGCQQPLSSRVLKEIEKHSVQSNCGFKYANINTA